MNSEFIPTMTKNFTYFLCPRRSIHQYRNANVSKHQPPDASTKELVAIRLMIGVIETQSNVYPSTSPAVPPMTSHFIFSSSGRELSKSFPARHPQIVWAAVGKKFIATHPPLFILFI